MLFLGGACSSKTSDVTGPSSVGLDAKPKRTVSLNCLSSVATTQVMLLDGGIFGNPVASSPILHCNDSVLLTGAGKADAYIAQVNISEPIPAVGCFLQGILPGKGVTGTCLGSDDTQANVVIK
jgi:hypothetical protein